MTERIFRATSPEFEEHAKLLDLMLTNWLDTPEGKKAMDDVVHDLLGIPRKGREPDYIHGRWCPRCGNSLPEDHDIKPCDVCGSATGFDVKDLDGLIQEGNPRESTVPYYGIPRVEKSPANR